MTPSSLNKKNTSCKHMLNNSILLYESLKKTFNNDNFDIVIVSYNGEVD